jgi:X-Pro dipeptidyl-peptidase C-terminal non-catalytic domain
MENMVAPRLREARIIDGSVGLAGHSVPSVGASRHRIPLAAVSVASPGSRAEYGLACLPRRVGRIDPGVWDGLGFDLGAEDEPLLYRFALPNANHVFRAGHRIMVQVQSSWFPLYDRNPQTFVENVFKAKPGDYRKATQRVWHSAKERSFIELPLVAR